MIPEGLSQREIDWLSKIKNGEEQLDKLEYKWDIYWTEKFIEFAKLMIKYENLKDIPEEGEFRRRSLIRLHRGIPYKELEFFNFEYTIMSGLYLVTDICFIDKKVMDKYYKRPLEDRRIELGLPDDVLLNASRLITEYNRPVYAMPVKSTLTDRYVHFQRDWSFPVW